MKPVNMTRHRYLDDHSPNLPDSQDSQLSVGSDDTVLDAVDEQYAVWATRRPDFDAWADDRTRRRCRWRCCRCRHVNRMPRSRLTMMHCRNPGSPSEKGGGDCCPRDGAGEAHMGPGACCVILVPRGMGPMADDEVDGPA